ncbi:MAG: hypothetical protein EBT53_08695 [Betaproteobacteria bacterium]|nr:hypothetical protein [Candidatus Fonsibacter lacus]
MGCRLWRPGGWRAQLNWRERLQRPHPWREAPNPHPHGLPVVYLPGARNIQHVLLPAQLAPLTFNPPSQNLNMVQAHGLRHGLIHQQPTRRCRGQRRRGRPRNNRLRPLG